MRNAKYLSLAALFILFAWVINSFSQDLFPETKRSLPEFNVPVLLTPNKVLTNKIFIGQVSLLNIWASWCKYCQLEHDFLLKIKNDYHVPMYGLNIKDDPADASAYLKQNGNPYVLSGSDPEGTLANTLENQATPETLIIDKYGMIRYRHLGVIDEIVWKNELWPRIQAYRKEN